MTPAFVEDPDAQVVLDILVASPADTSNVVASAKIGHPIAVRFLSPEGTNYEVALKAGVFGSATGGLVPTPADMKAQGIDRVDVLQWETAALAPGRYRLELSWIWATSLFHVFGEDHLVAIDVSLTNG